MTLFVPQGGTWVPHDAQELIVKLHVGEPTLGWPGDHRLDLRMREVLDPATGRTGRRWEVWRRCEDGATRFIGSWPLHESSRIVADLAAMRVDSPGRVDVLEQIDKANERRLKELEDQRMDEVGPILEDWTRAVVRARGRRMWGYGD